MANRRMFSISVVGSDEFLDMPVSARELYFQLGMYADDDGFVSHKRVQRTCGATNDDMKVLIAKRFVIPFESGVIVLRHWNENNYIQKDRYKPTLFTYEKGLLRIEKDNVYILDTECTRSIGKDRLGEVSVRKISSEISSLLKEEVPPTLTLEEYIQEQAEEEYIDDERVYRRDGKLVSLKTLEKEYSKRYPAPSVRPKMAPRTHESFDYDSWLGVLENSSKKVEKIIAFVWKERGYKFENYEQWRQRMGQDVKYAKQLEGYKPDQVKEVIEILNKEERELNYKWSMSTIAKRIANVTV